MSRAFSSLTTVAPGLGGCVGPAFEFVGVDPFVFAFVDTLTFAGAFVFDGTFTFFTFAFAVVFVAVLDAALEGGWFVGPTFFTGSVGRE
jgi:hypothetical protein